MSILKESIRCAIYESIEPSFTEVPKDKMVGYLVKSGMEFSTQIHILHLLTDNAQIHSLLGNLYENSFITLDQIAEEYLAMGGECEGAWQSTIYYDYSEELIHETIGDFYKLVNETIQYLDSPEKESIKNKVMQLQKYIHKAEYQLNLE